MAKINFSNTSIPPEPPDPDTLPVLKLVPLTLEEMVEVRQHMREWLEKYDNEKKVVTQDANT